MREKFIGVFFLCVLFVVFFSCAEKVVVNDLVQAEGLMQTRPDSALKLLESIPFPENMDQADYAYYCLLLTEALDKTYYDFTSDSIIRIALDHYERTRDKQRLPKAYYYMGRVCHTLYNAPQAINYYLKAKDVLVKDSDYPLEARIYNQLGSLYVALRFNKNASSAYEKAYESLSLAGDSVNLPYILRDIARTHNASGRIDSTVICYYKAIREAVKVGNVDCEISSRIELASMLLEENRLAEAREQKEKAINLYNGRKLTPQTQLILGEFFEAAGQLDSARYYFNQSINTTNLYTHAASIRRLALLEEKEQNYKQAVFYNHQYSACKDSIEMMMNRVDVSEMEHFYNYQQIENENNRLKIESGRRQLVYTIFYFSITLVLILVIAYFFYYRQKKKKEMLLKEKDMLYKEEQYRKSREKIKANLQEIQILKDNLEKNSSRLDQVSQELIRTKTELLEQQNKQIELSIHHISLKRQKLLDSPLYKRVKALAVNEILREPNWLQFKEEMDMIYEDFESQLRVLYPFMSEIELKVCYLIKADFNVSETAILLGRAKPSITSCRKRLYEKIKGTPGTAEALDLIIIGLD